MKKLYIITLSFFAISYANAQTSYTLTQANSEGVIGDKYVAKGVDTTNTLPMTISGANVTWNFTGLVDSLSIDSNSFISPSADPNSANYPGVTIVQTAGTNVSYFKSSTNQFELLGVDISFGANTANLNYNTNSAILAQYNMSYGYTNTDAVSGDISAMGQTGTFTGTINTIVDGTGTLNLNGVSMLSNCIRVKTTQHLSFTLASGIITGTFDQSIYNYYNNSSKFPVFTVSYSHVIIPPVPVLLPSGINQTQVRVNTLSNIAIGIKEYNKNDITFNTYPNPANNEVGLHFVLTNQESYTAEISNTLGQVIKTVSMLNLQPGIYNETINTSDLSAGVYTIKVSGKNAQGTKKLIIQK